MKTEQWIFSNKDGESIVRIPMIMPEELTCIFTTYKEAESKLEHYLSAIGYADSSS